VGDGGPTDAGTVGDAAIGVPLPRTPTQLTSWRFIASNSLTGAEAPTFDDGAWQSVTVPHTFEGRGVPFVTYSHAWYRTHFHLDASTAGGRVYVQFEGAGTIADVYVNGQQLGEHRGLYTAFTLDASPAAVAGDNVLAVRIDNTDASSGDTLPATPVARNYFEPYGGIYRKAWLLAVDPIHVAPTDLGSSGVYLTPKVPESGGNGTLEARTIVRNTSAATRAVHVTHLVNDAANTTVATLATDVMVGAGATVTSDATGTVPSPHPWAPGNPYLYSVVTRLSVDGVVRDSMTEPIGFRTFRLTTTDFFVNGVSTPLRGVAKHQESEDHFAAMTDDELRADWGAMQAVGFDFVRLVHYPHARLEYDLADQLGMVVWTENGYVTPNAWTQTADTETREWVRQNYNHPSIAFWDVGNESVSANDATTVDAMERFAKAVHEEDSTRLVTYANSNSNIPFSDPALDFMGQNLYEGLTQNNPWGFENDAAAFHYVSENGSRAEVTQHSDYATAVSSRVANVFEPEEFIQPTVEASAETVFRTRSGQVPLFAWWAFRDFQLYGRIDGICNNGLYTWDGVHPKDHAFLFESFLLKTPVVHILGATYFVRRGAANNGIKVYSNAAKLDLAIDGTDMGTLTAGSYTQPNGRTVDETFYWPVTLFQGPNYVHVDDGAGHGDDIFVVFAGTGGQAPPMLTQTPIVSQVTSSNAANPAYFIDRPIAPDFPVYYDLDGTADNSFAALPAQLAGAAQVGTLRLSKTQNLTDLSLTIATSAAKGADVFILTTDDGSSLSMWTGVGFADSGVTGSWRDTAMDLVPVKLLQTHVAGGASVTVPGTTRDYVVLVKATP